MCAPRPTRPRSWCSCERPKRSACSITITVALGTSTPTSIDRRRDEDVELAAHERAHDAILGVLLQPSVQQRDADTPGRRPATGDPPSRSPPSGRPSRTPRSADRRCRPAGPARSPCGRRRRSRRAATRARRRRDRLAARRHLAHHRDVEIAVGRQRQRARDRRGGHHEDVGVQPLGAQRRALQDAEAVLLVDDREARARGTRRPPAPARACRSPSGASRPRAPRAPRAACAPACRRSAARSGTATVSSSRRMLKKCCSARISVGAMKATCRPFSIATSAAISATIVLPDPTSPCSSRFIGCGRCMSVTISRITVFWSPVSLNGRIRRTASRMSSVTTTGAALALGVGAAPPQDDPELKEEELLEDQPAVRGRAERVQLARSRRPARESAPARARRGDRSASAAGARPRASGSGSCAGIACSAWCTSVRCIFAVSWPVFS